MCRVQLLRWFGLQSYEQVLQGSSSGRSLGLLWWVQQNWTWGERPQRSEVPISHNSIGDSGVFEMRVEVWFTLDRIPRTQYWHCSLGPVGGGSADSLHSESYSNQPKEVPIWRYSSTCLKYLIFSRSVLKHYYAHESLPLIPHLIRFWVNSRA